MLTGIKYVSNCISVTRKPRKYLRITFKYELANNNRPPKTIKIFMLEVVAATMYNKLALSEKKTSKIYS